MERERARPVALITGCSSGLGRALALELLRREHEVVATARVPAALAELAAGGARTMRLDVTDAAEVESVVAQATAAFGRIDMLVNNAGFGLIGPCAELEPAALRRQLETNVVGPLALIAAVVPGMARRGSGRIVNIGSVSGVTATPFAGAYCASKAAMHSLSEALRLELSPFGIAVVEVQPGAFSSSFGASAAAAVGRYRNGSLYSPIADAIEARARLSESRSSPVEGVALEIVDAVTAARPPALLRVGRGSRLLPLIGRLPRALRDRILSRRFRLDRLARTSP
jgi:NAD(P)-dependent dehydrogenase (short-subunit alcohol dehydrogenase family)